MIYLFVSSITKENLKCVFATEIWEPIEPSYQYTTFIWEPLQWNPLEQSRIGRQVNFSIIYFSEEGDTKLGSSLPRILQRTSFHLGGFLRGSSTLKGSWRGSFWEDLPPWKDPRTDFFRTSPFRRSLRGSSSRIVLILSPFSGSLRGSFQNYLLSLEDPYEDPYFFSMDSVVNEYITWHKLLIMFERDFAPLCFQSHHFIILHETALYSANGFEHLKSIKLCYYFWACKHRNTVNPC